MVRAEEPPRDALLRQPDPRIRAPGHPQGPSQQDGPLLQARAPLRPRDAEGAREGALRLLQAHGEDVRANHHDRPEAKVLLGGHGQADQGVPKGEEAGSLAGDRGGLEDGQARRPPGLGGRFRERRVDGVFTSPPYVGQIDYHEQHRYAYELFGIERRDGLEIGPKTRARGSARRATTRGAWPSRSAT
jgi:hypothetical protein